MQVRSAEVENEIPFDGKYPVIMESKKTTGLVVLFVTKGRGMALSQGITNNPVGVLADDWVAATDATIWKVSKKSFVISN